MDYGMRIVRALHQNGQLSALEIARLECMQPAITYKILKKLTHSGMVESHRGPEGGYMLSRSCETLTLHDLFGILDEKLLMNRCTEPGYQCENDPDGQCGCCREFCRIQQVLETELKRTPLSVVFQ